MVTYANTHQGMVRSNNQDGFVVEIFEQEQTVLLVVCDGMGGANAGNVASHVALEIFSQGVQEQFEQDMNDTQKEDMLRISAQNANKAVYDVSIKQPECRGMGTTLVGAIAEGNKITLINIGDSRAYKITKENIEQITEDHSFVQEMVRKGKLTPEEARNHPHRNLITRAIGVEEFVSSDLYHCVLEKDDVLLLCSDGLSGMVDDNEIADIVRSSENIEQAVDNLIMRACDNGGLDNITVAVYSCAEPLEQLGES